MAYLTIRPRINHEVNSSMDGLVGVHGTSQLIRIIVI